MSNLPPFFVAIRISAPSIGFPLASLTIPCSTEPAPNALETKSASPTNPIQIDLINITNQKRKCGEKHKIHLTKIDKASLRVSCFVVAAGIPVVSGGHLVIPLFFANTREN